MQNCGWSGTAVFNFKCHNTICTYIYIIYNLLNSILYWSVHVSHHYLHSYLKHCLEHKVITVMNDYINNKNCSYPDMWFFSYLTSIKKKKTCTITPLLCLNSSRKFLSNDNAFTQLTEQLLYIIQGSMVGSSCPGSSLDCTFTEVFGMFTRAFGSMFCFCLPAVCLCPVADRKPNAANCSADTPALVLFRDIGPVCFCFPGPSLDFQNASYAPGAWYLWIRTFSKFFIWNIKLVTDDSRLSLQQYCFWAPYRIINKTSYCIAWN